MSLTVRFHEFGGPDVLTIEDLPVPEPGPGEVLVRVETIGLNRAEVNFRKGRYIEQPRELPSLIGYECAGTVESAGPGVTGLAAGQPVSVVPAFSMREYGVYGERVIVPAAAVVVRPERVDATTGAAAWMALLTVYGALVDIGGIRAGDAVVINAASSSVGLSAIRLVNHVGGQPIAVTRSSAKRDELAGFGAAAVVATDKEDLVEGVLEATGGAGARFVFDAVAGPGVRDLARTVAPGGLHVIHGTLSGQPTPFPGVERMSAYSMRSYTLFEITKDPARLEKAKGFITAGLVSGALAPVVDRTFPFSGIADAHRYLETGTQVGKVVVNVG
ncbi:zinc-dependent alcohol dehydrogenase family protein [Actinacidiphila sp. ITFR-21]|uniref:zinc-dependent alcohol dehydrogenase family protein n=1 Tax=Actinacidiphila sp. ITFR-21 TaxID=3075199 RepID=UPI0028890DD3|nr:zinc-dependent alcohol dehydrogenase family protein [Streptomyces sp. ITFR-21]WNI18791.1 zinc-dependent alcohol dehydrogenase family protein [Streptomyces sp. ITFR-21]